MVTGVNRLPKRVFLFFVLSFFSVSSAHAIYPQSDLMLKRLAFGGCSFQRVSQKFWPAILETKPDLWVWNGDIIYADKLHPALRRNEYNHLKSNRFYSEFRELMPIIGVWDDHDYYANNVGQNVPWKKQSQSILLDFLDEPKESARRKQTGVYTSYTFNEKGSRIQLILLDERTFRGEPNQNQSILGADQWQWFENELKASDADLVLLVSSSIVISDKSGEENWGDYPGDKARLFRLIGEHPRPVLILSGDQHLAEFSKVTLPNGNELYEFTASGLTHSSLGESVAANPNRVGEPFLDKNFGGIDFHWSPNAIGVDMKRYSIEGKLHDTLSLSFGR